MTSTPHPPAGSPRRPAASALGGLLTAVLAALLVAGSAVPAQAAGYRYWSFWKDADGGWAYQQQGPAIHVPADGSVDGWRFAVSPDGGQNAAQPRATTDFAALCASTPPQGGRKRVGVVLDFGTAADGSSEQPPEQRTACATVPANATSAEVLAAVAPPLRYNTNGLLCAIAGYPKAGCGDQVGAGAQAAAKPSSDDSGPDLGLVAGGALVAVLAAGAVWQARRRPR
ncbi:SCO2322 family protein [Kitasatospora sp. NPDC001660]